MKKTLITLVSGLMIGGAAIAGPVGTSGKVVTPPPPPPPAGPEFSAAIDIDYATSYEFRGYDLGDHLVSGGLNLGLDWGNGFSAGLYTWLAWLPDADDDYLELDITPSITYDFGPMTASLLYTRYEYLEGDIDATNELGLVLGTNPDLLGGVSVSLGSYYDFDIEGWFFQLGAGYSHALNDMVSLDFAAGVSYVVDYGVTDSGFNHLFVGMGIPVKVNETITIKPYVRGVFPIDVLDDAGQDDQVIGGVNVSFSF
jgi:hypothetical protein